MDDPNSHRWQWALRRIHAPQAWTLTRGDRNLVVAVVDTGVDADHPELAGRVLRGYNVVAPHQSSLDDNGHGTAVAGLVAAKGGNSRGFAGVAPDVKILPVKVNQPGSGNVHARHIAAGIKWAATHGARVINASVGVVKWEHDLTDDALDEMSDAIRYAIAHGIVVCVAAGPPMSPIPFPGMWSVLWDFRGLVAVGGTDRHDHKAGCSPTGNFISVTAPSDGVLTTYPRAHGHLYSTFGGTSAASPHVAGLAALILSLRPTLHPHEVKAILPRTADKLGGSDYHPDFGFGRIHCHQALQAALEKPAAAFEEGA